MRNIIHAGERFLAKSLSDHASVVCDYRQGRSSVPVNAAFGKRLMEIRQMDNTVMVANVRTAILSTAQLNGIIPRSGDKITNGSESWVVGLPGNNVAFEYFGTTKTMIRVYLRKDDAEKPAG